MLVYFVKLLIWKTSTRQLQNSRKVSFLDWKMCALTQSTSSSFFSPYFWRTRQQTQILGWAVEFPTRFSRRCSARIGLAMARWKRSWRTCTVRGTRDIFEHRKVNPRHQKSWQTHNMARRNFSTAMPYIWCADGWSERGNESSRYNACPVAWVIFFFQVGRIESFPSRFSACVFNGNTNSIYCPNPLQHVESDEFWGGSCAAGSAPDSRTRKWKNDPRWIGWLSSCLYPVYKDWHRAGFVDLGMKERKFKF